MSRRTAFAFRMLVVVLALTSIDLYESAIALASQVDPTLEIPQDVAIASRWAVAGVAITALIALFGSSLFRAARYVRHAPAASSQPVARELGAFPVNPDWIKSGTPVFKGIEMTRSADGKSVTGLWSCEGPGTFEWQYSGDETVCLLEGQVHVEYMGRQFTLNAGESAVFHYGTRALWNVPKYVRKVYTIDELDFPVRVWRRILRLVK